MIDVPGARLWTVRRGMGQDMVLLHGGPGMWDYLEPVASALSDIAASVRYDQRGCGQSSGAPPYDMATAVADLDAIRRAWNVDKWVVLGHSWGATLALAYALNYPERVQALVYVAGTGLDPAWHEEYRARRLARLGPTQVERWHELRDVGAAHNTAELAREYAELYTATDVSDVTLAATVFAAIHARGFRPNPHVNQALGSDARAFAENPNIGARLVNLDLPALILHGEDDPRPWRFAASVAETIPNAQLLVLPRCGHYPWLEAPEPFYDRLRTFMAQHLPV
jgi:proline iminopeptidase